DPAPRFADILATIADALQTALPELRYVGAHERLPLTLPESYWPLERASLGKARSAGFRHRPLAETVRDIYDWAGKARANGSYPASGWPEGPSAVEEAEI